MRYIVDPPKSPCKKSEASSVLPHGTKSEASLVIPPLVGGNEGGKGDFDLLYFITEQTAVSCHAFKLGISSEQDAY